MEICIFCNKEFIKSYNKQKYCSTSCAGNSRKIKIIRTCENCQIEYSPKRKNKNEKYCSQKCYFEARDQSLEKICEFCKNSFIIAYRFREQKYCNVKCAGMACSLNTKQERIHKICQNCLKDYEVIESRKDSKFCSYDCFLNDVRDGSPKYIKKICEAKNCGKEFECLWRANNRFCSRSCASSGENNFMYNNHVCYRFTPPWTKGKSAKTDPKLAELGKKISLVMKEQFANKEKNHFGKNNPNYGKTREDRTSEQLENYSKAAIKRIADGSTVGYGRGHKHGWYKSSKMGIEIYYRSSYEERLMKVFDKWDEVVSYAYEPFVLIYDVGKRYLIDFLVHFKDGRQLLIESKPEFLLTNEIVLKKKEAALKYAFENNIEYEIWTNKEISLFESYIEENSV